MSVLELRGVSKTYEGAGETVQAVRRVDLEVSEGEVVVMFGPSGSGKSTLLLLAAGALQPNSGTVLFRGRDLAGLSDSELAKHLRCDVGIAYQYPQLLPGHSALSNVAVKLLSGPGSLYDAQRAALPWLARVGLSERIDHRPHELSGGERTRVALARAFLDAPALLLMDEPTANLDRARRREILDLIASRAGDGAAVLLMTHDEDATGIASRVHELRDGTLGRSTRERAA